jgi:hypothetical protein
MKTTKNILNILIISSAFLMLFGGIAGAASKIGTDTAAIKIPAMEKINKSVEVQEPRVMNYDILNSSKPENGMEVLQLEQYTAAPNGIMQEIGIKSGEDKSVAPPTEGLLMKMYLEEQGSRNGPSGELAFPPETIRDPALDPNLEGNRHRLEDRNGVEGLRHPAHDLIDPKYLPGPDRKNPDVCSEAFIYWFQMNYYYNIAREDHPNWSEAMTVPANREKYIDTYMANPNRHQSRDEYQEINAECPSEKSGKENDTSNDDLSEKIKPDDENGAVEEKPVKDEADGQPDAERDSNPEGDDPDEIMNPAARLAMKKQLGSAIEPEAEHSNSGGRPNESDQGGNGPEFQGSMAQGTGLPGVNRVEGEARPDPEDGGPDELNSPTASQAINSAMTSGANYQPEPGGDDPDDPRASAAGNVMAAGNSGYAASPAIGDNGKEPGPIGPQF